MKQLYFAIEDPSLNFLSLKIARECADGSFGVFSDCCFECGQIMEAWQAENRFLRRKKKVVDNSKKSK